MRLKCLTIFFAVLAAASVPRTAHAQDFDYDSYGVYDPYSNEISGYSITVDYMGYNVDLEADSDLLDPDEETVDSSSDDEIGEAEADVYCVPEQTGTYEIYGSHWYDGDGWDWLGESYDDLDVSDIVTSVSAGSQPWYSGSQTWYSDSPDNPYSITINGLGFTDQPSLSGCSGGIDSSSWTVNYTQISGSLHVSTALSTACTLVLMVGDFAAPPISLEPGTPIVTISCPLGIPKGGSDTCSLAASPLGTQVTLLLSASTGSGSATFDDGSTSKSLTISAPTTVTIKGVDASSTADNITLAASVDGENIASTSFSVVSVSISLNASGSPAGDDAARTAYLQTVVSGGPLGPEINNSNNNTTCSIGVELAGTVSPSNYRGTITLLRNLVSGSTYFSSVLASTISPGPDNSGTSQLDTDPQSGGSNGKVYDLDAPGLSGGSLVHRARYNFQEYAALGSDPTKQVSSNFPYYAAVSCGVDGSGNPVIYSGVNGDNQAGSGTINVTWDLQ